VNHKLNYDTQSRILTGTAEGTPSLDDFQAYVTELAQHPDLDECVGIISDHRRITSSNLSHDSIRTLTLHVSLYADRWRDTPHPIVSGSAGPLWDGPHVPGPRGR
jgi:capsule polysaccharide export protein KpsC/LpsZ